MKYLDFLDEPGTPLIEHELPEDTNPSAVVERFVEFMDDLFTNIFWKSYYENIKKNN